MILSSALLVVLKLLPGAWGSEVYRGRYTPAFGALDALNSLLVEVNPFLIILHIYIGTYRLCLFNYISMYVYLYVYIYIYIICAQSISGQKPTYR